MKLFLIIFFLFHTTLLYSDDTIDEIIVTAELSDNSLYRLPISASVIDEEVIRIETHNILKTSYFQYLILIIQQDHLEENFYKFVELEKEVSLLIL